MSEAAVTEPGHEARGTQYAIVVNGELVVVPGEVVSYAEVVAIAYPVPPGPDTTYTVGQTVEVRKEGTTFDVVPGGKS